MEILVTCFQRPLDDLVQVRVRSSWRSPGEIFSVSLHDLAQVLVRRSCGDPAGISLKSLTQQVALHQDIEDALHWCLYEKSSGMFIESCSCEILYIKGPCLAIF